jgi:hypothetical protein
MAIADLMIDECGLLAKIYILQSQSALANHQIRSHQSAIRNPLTSH